MTPEAKLKGKRIAVFVDQLYQEMEVWYPYYRLIEEGAEVHLVGAEAGKTYPSIVLDKDGRGLHFFSDYRYSKPVYVL